MSKETIKVTEPYKALDVLTVNDAGEKHRSTYVPGADLTNASDAVRHAAAENWTDGVIADFRAAQAELERGGLDEAEFRVSQISAECRRRIYAVASNEAQMNMAAASALISSKTASARSDEEKAVLAGLEAALGWVNAMRNNVQTLAADPAANFMDDGQWPAPPDIATTIIAQF